MLWFYLFSSESILMILVKITVSRMRIYIKIYIYIYSVLVSTDLYNNYNVIRYITEQEPSNVLDQSKSMKISV